VAIYRPKTGAEGQAVRLAGIARQTGREALKLSIARPCRHPPHEGEDKTKGGIIIPDTVKEKPQEGEVIAVGPGAGTRAVKLVPLNPKRATGYCSANGLAPRSRLTARDL
jgi:hypothetical protein